MQKPCNPSYGWSLVVALTLVMTSHANAQVPAIQIVFKGDHRVAAASIHEPSNLIEIAPGIPLSPQSLAETSVSDAASIGSSSMALPSIAATRNMIESRNVACRAASQWLPAKQLRQHAQAMQGLYCEEDDCARQAASAVASFLRMQADHQQDVAAAMALRAYYALVAIDEQFELLALSAAELQKQQERQAAIQQKGMAAAIDLTSLDRESILLNTQQLHLQQRQRQLRQSLTDATQTQYDWQASTFEPLELRVQFVDAPYLENFALAHRHDFLAIQCLSFQINTGTAPLLSSIVNSATGMASLPLPKRCLVDRMLGRESNALLTKNLKESMAIACEAQSQSIRREVAEKAIALELAYQRIPLSNETITSWNKRISQLQRLAELGDSRPADIALAQSSVLAAQAIEIERRLEAKLAEITLAETCGGLSNRCCQGLAWLVTAEIQ